MSTRITSMYNPRAVRHRTLLEYLSIPLKQYLESKCERRSGNPIGLMGSGFRIELLQLAVF